MKVWDYIDVNKLEGYIDSGFITCKFHKQFKDLMILSYGRETVQQQHWTPLTMRCRGLIVNMTTGDVIARPFEKFFDAGDPASVPPSGYELESRADRPLVLEKLNGSLGILYTGPDDQHYIASKASFHSKHAEWATNWYRENVRHGAWPFGYTPVFEMICQDIQPHTVKYDKDGLYLIGLINIDTGEELPYELLVSFAAHNNVGAARKFDLTLEQAMAAETPNEEGYVIAWHRPGTTPLRVRVKFKEFLRKRKLFNSITQKLVFEQMCNDRHFDEEALSLLPAHLAQRVRDWQSDLRSEYFRIKHSASIIMQRALTECSTRKEFAKFVNIRPFAPVCFALMDEKDYKRVIWKIIEKNYQFEEQEDVA